MKKILSFVVLALVGFSLHAEVEPIDCFSEIVAGQMPEAAKLKKCTVRCENLLQQATEREFSESEKHEFQNCAGLQSLSDALLRGDFDHPCKWLDALASTTELTPRQQTDFQACVLKGHNR